MNQTGKQMVVTSALLMGKALAAVATSSTFGNLLLGVVGSYIANHIPTLNSVHFEKRVEAAYMRAIKKLTKEGYDESLCKGISSLDVLKKYAKSGMPESDGLLARLFSLWVSELHEDPSCSQYVVELKLSEVSERLSETLSIIRRLQYTIEDLDNYLRKFKTKGCCDAKEVEGHIKRFCWDNELIPGADLFYDNAERLELEDYVVRGLFSRTSHPHYALYSSMQMGKTTELRHLAWRLQKGGMFQPLFISLEGVPSLGFDDLPSDDMLNDKPFVLLIDAIDEAEGGSFATVMRQLNNYALHHPKMRIVVSCRTNFRRDEVLSTFMPLTLAPLSWQDITDYIHTEIPADADNVILQINKAGVGEIARNPRDLKAIIDDYVKSGKIPSTRIELMDHFVQNRYNVEKAKAIEPFPITKEEECRRLQRVAAIMLCSGKRELSEDEFRRCLNNGADELYQHLRYELVVQTEGKVAFCNNSIMEYMAACYLLELDSVDKVKSLVCYKDTEKFRPLWYSTLLLWVDLLKQHSGVNVSAQIASDATEWLMEHAKELLYNSDIGLLSNEEKGELMIAALKDCKSGNTTFNGLLNDLSLRKLKLPLNLVRYILEQWKSIDCADNHLGNITHLTLALDWDALEQSDLQLCKDLEDELFANLEKPFYMGKNKECAYTALSNNHFFTDVFVRRFADVVSKRVDVDDMQSLTIRISGLDNTDHYTDYLLKVEREMVSNYLSGRTRVVFRDYVYRALGKIAEPDNVKKVLKCIVDEHYWRYQDKKEEAEKTAKTIIERAKALNDNTLAPTIENAERRLQYQISPFVHVWDEERQQTAITREQNERKLLCNHALFVGECRSILTDPYRKGHEPVDILRLCDPVKNGRGDINRYVIEFLNQCSATIESDKIIVNEKVAREALNSDEVYERFRFLKLNEIKENGMSLIPLSDEEKVLYFQYAQKRVMIMLNNPIIVFGNDVIRIVIELLLNGVFDTTLSEDQWIALLSYASQPLSASIDDLGYDIQNKVISAVQRHVPETKILSECHRIVSTMYGRISFYSYNVYAKFLIEKQHRESLEFFEQIILNANNDAEELLELCIKNNCLIESFKTNARKLQPVLHIDLCELLMTDKSHHQWIKEELSRLHSNYRYPDMKRRLSMLYRLGSDDALRLTLSNHHLLHYTDNPDFRYNDLPSAELLARMLNLCMQKKMFVNTINTILESLSNIAFQSRESLSYVQSLFMGKNKIVKTLGKGCLTPEQWAIRLTERYLDHIQPVLTVMEAKQLISSL